MKSDMIQIDNQGTGFDKAVAETERTARFQGLNHKESLRLQLCVEEMLSMARSITGEMLASFWLESVGKKFELHMTTKTVMDKEKRYLLLSSTSDKKNQAANSFLGRLRDAFESAMAADVDRTYFELPPELQGDLSGRIVDNPEWDRYEQSVLFRLADNVQIGIRGGQVHMIVTKSF